MARHAESKPTRISTLKVGDYLSFEEGTVHEITMVIKHGRYSRQIYFEPEHVSGKKSFNAHGVDMLHRLPKRLGRKLYQGQNQKL